MLLLSLNNARPEILSDEIQLNSDTLFLMSGVRNQNTTKSRPSSAQQQNAGGAIITQYWMLAWNILIFQGIWTSIAKEPQRFPIFQGGGQDTLPPPLWIRAS